jgi:hypothetical protein
MKELAQKLLQQQPEVEMAAPVDGNQKHVIVQLRFSIK